MRLLLSVIIVPTLVGAAAQDQNPREMMLSSKGNLRVSALFREAAVLPTDDLQSEIYRLTIVPTFYSPIKIRVEKRDDTAFLVFKRLSGQGGWEETLGKLETEQRRPLRSQEWNRLLELLQTAGFWELPHSEKDPEPNEKGEMTICLDDAGWVIEGVKNGRYHVVNRYCSEDRRFGAIGLYLVRLSGIPIREYELH